MRDVVRHNTCMDDEFSDKKFVATKPITNNPKLIRIYEERFADEKPEPLWKPLGSERIRSIRAATGLSRTKFCKLFGFNIKTLQNWEEGRNNPEVFNNLLLRIIEVDAEAVIKLLDTVKERQATEV